MEIRPILEGMGMGFGLIVAIGAQNAFVLKQGLLKQHTFPIALACAILDVLLIFGGIGGLGFVFTNSPLLMKTARWGGAVFLVWYGARAFRQALSKQVLQMGAHDKRLTFAQAMAQTLAFTLLNPHAYLDACLLGSVGAQYPSPGRWLFASGASVASLMWFFSLSYGARLLIPFFENPLAWKLLDFLIGCGMWGIALSLILTA